MRNIMRLGVAPFCAALAGTSTGRADAAEKVALAYSSLDASSLPWFYAQEKGYFTKHGLDSAALIYFDSGAKGVQALVGGSADIITADGNALVNAIMAGADVRAVGVNLGVLPSTVVVAKDIKTAQDLRGKKFAISSFGSETQMGEKLFLKANGLSESDVTTM